MQQHKQAFTLIELLVVILIIGILAAVALPQYRVAVMKTKIMGLAATVKAIKQAEELYYLENGVYTGYFENLDSITLPANFSIDSSDKGYAQDGNLRLDLFSGVTGAVVLPNNSSTGAYVGAEYRSETDNIWYSHYLTHSAYPDRIICRGTGPIGSKVCKTLGGSLENESDIYIL